MNRVAVLSDIHGNMPALEAVVADAQALGCDRFVNLGDSLSGPLWPVETADFLIERDWPTIAGNHERQLLAAGDMGASDAVTSAQLSPHHLDWIATLPPTRVSDSMMLCHGTPGSDVVHLTCVVDADGLHPANEAMIAQALRDVGQRLVLCGHTHLPAVRTLADGRVVANPGSVGLQAYTDDRPFAYAVAVGDPRARYASVDGVEVTPRSVAYDHGSAAAKARAASFDDWAVWLEYGRVRRPIAGRVIAPPDRCGSSSPPHPPDPSRC